MKISLLGATSRLAGFILLCLSLPACAFTSASNSPAVAKISILSSSKSTPESAQRALESKQSAATGWMRTTLASYYPQESLAYPSYVAQLYQTTGFQNFWLDPQGRPNAAALSLVQDLKPWLALEPNPRQDLYRQVYELLIRPVNTNLPRHHQATDILITDRFLSYQQDLLTGYWTRFDHDQDHGITNAYESWDAWPDEVSFSSLEQQWPDWLTSLALTTPSTWAQQRIAASQPNQKYYQPWRQAFTQLEEIAAAGDWPQIDGYLMLGSRNAAVTRLAVQLHSLGDLASLANYLPRNAEQPLFDKELELAVKNFQLRHNLEPTGATNKLTKHWLNLEPQARMRIVAHNLRRLQHLPKQLNKHYLMVNLADQTLSLVADGQVKLDMKIVVGRTGYRTPIMNQWLTSLVLNPLWNVPNSIARSSIFPRALQNPRYFAERDYALVEGWSTPVKFVPLDQVPADAFEKERPSYRIVQKSGNYNQLGRAKFRLSNQQAIYLHDTPYRQVFQAQQRDLSSGCIRLEDSAQLVEALLGLDPAWNPEDLAAIYAQGEERYLQIRPRVAVYLMYWTLWVDPAGRTHWRSDPYQKDTLAEPSYLAAQQAASS